MSNQEDDLIIEHVMQSEDLNCVSACLSMVTGIPIHQVTKEFHEKYVNGVMEPWEYLDNKGCSYVRPCASDRELEPRTIYTLTVPSLNIVGGLHEIVAQLTNKMTWYILDPNLGKQNRKVYVAKVTCDLDPQYYVPIKAYMVSLKMSYDSIKQNYTRFTL